MPKLYIFLQGEAYDECYRFAVLDMDDKLKAALYRYMSKRTNLNMGMLLKGLNIN